MKFKNSLIFFYFAVAILIAKPAQGVVLFDSTSNPVFDYESINQNIIFNASFSTPDYPIELRDISLLWRRGVNENGLIRIDLLSDKNSTPGKVISELSFINSTELPIGKQVLAVSLRYKVLLNPETRYWIRIRASGSPGALAYSRHHGGYGVAGEFYLNMYGFHKNSETGPYLFKVNGNRFKPE